MCISFLYFVIEYEREYFSYEMVFILCYTTKERDLKGESGSGFIDFFEGP